MMRALTLHPEWTVAFQLLGKDTENRPQQCPAFARPTLYGPGPWIAMHAGKHIGGRPNNDGALGTVIEVARLAGWSGTVGPPPDPRFSPSVILARPGWKSVALHPDYVRCSAIVGLFRVVAVHPPGVVRPWKFRESWGMQVEYKHLAEPVEGVAGAQGWWTVRPEHEAAVRAQARWLP